MRLIEKFNDWCSKELDGIDKWINGSLFCKTKSDILQAQHNSLQRMLGVALFIQTLDNAPTFEEIDFYYDHWKKKIKNLCELKLTTL